MLQVKAHALLAQVIAAKVQALFRIGRRAGKGAEAARAGSFASFELDYFGAEQGHQHAGKLAALVAIFDNYDSVQGRAQIRVDGQITHSSLRVAISSRVSPSRSR